MDEALGQHKLLTFSVMNYDSLDVSIKFILCMLVCVKYMLKHCREYFTKNKVRGARPSTLFS